MQVCTFQKMTSLMGQGSSCPADCQASARLLSFSRRKESTWLIAKSRLGSEILQTNDYPILLANHPALRKLIEYMGVPQGRRT